jgi:hypothetical protein
MYRSARSIESAAEQHSYEEVNSDIDEPENLASDISVQEHLKPKNFVKAQEALIDIDITSTPTKLAQTIGSNVWSILPSLTKELKQNMALKNRHLATGDDLAGNLNRCIPLHLEVLQQKNTFPYFMGIRIPGMMNATLSKDGQYVHRVPPDTPTMMVKENVFVPQNVVNQYMYKNYQLCTLEELASDITFVPKTSKKPGTAHVQVGSLAYETLLDNLANGAWQEELPHIEVEDIFEPGRNHTVQITEKMGRQLYSKLEGPLKEAAESFIDLNDFNAEIVRADGYEAFDSPKGIHGAIIGSEIVPSKKLQQTRMMTEACFHIKARLTYILF